MASHEAASLKTYWVTWSVLLLLTVVMLVLDQAPMSRRLFVVVMVAAMVIKATLIAGNFMHLRFERLALVLMILVGLFVNGAILYGLIVPDALRIVGMGP